MDEKYLEADAELGGIDQRKIFGYSRDFMPKIGNALKFTHLMNPIISLSKKGKSKETELQKMSASDPTSKIDIIDSPEKIKATINKLCCIDGVVDDNNVLYLIKIFVFPIAGQFELIRDQKYGSSKIFNSYDDLEKQVENGSANNGVHPFDLKNSVYVFFSNLFEPIRKEFSSENYIELLKNAYDL